MPNVALSLNISTDYAALATANGTVLSFSPTGCAYDDAVAESFFATIKRELVTTRPWHSIAQLRRAVFDHIEGISTTVTGSTARSATRAPSTGEPFTGRPLPRLHN